MHEVPFDSKRAVVPNTAGKVYMDGLRTPQSPPPPPPLEPLTQPEKLQGQQLTYDQQQVQQQQQQQQQQQLQQQEPQHFGTTCENFKQQQQLQQQEPQHFGTPSENFEQQQQQQQEGDPVTPQILHGSTQTHADHVTLWSPSTDGQFGGDSGVGGKSGGEGRLCGGAGVYVVGWLKRGPSGIIGTNAVDADETVASIAEVGILLPSCQVALSVAFCAPH